MTRSTTPHWPKHPIFIMEIAKYCRRTPDELYDFLVKKAIETGIPPEQAAYAMHSRVKMERGRKGS